MGNTYSKSKQQHKFPPPPADGLDWNNLGVGVLREVNGHIECRWTAETQQWGEPKLVKSPVLGIHGLSSALNYGMQAFEGMKAVRDPSGEIRVFRPDRHAARMQHSCECVSIPPIPQDLFIRSVSAAVSSNAEFVPPFDTPAALYIRPLVFGSGARLDIVSPSEFTFCVFVQPTAALLGHAAPIKALVLEDFDRAAPRGTGSAKVGGNYAPIMRYQKTAKGEGYGITLHLDSQTRSEIDEFSAAGFIGVKRKTGDRPLLVIPDSKNVITSVTSDSCVELAKSLGWGVEHRSIKYEELDSFDEVLAVGTAAIVVPIKSIDRKSMNQTISYDRAEQDGKVEETCFKTLFKKILDAQRGLGDSGKSWTVVVQRPESYIVT